MLARSLATLVALLFWAQSLSAQQKAFHLDLNIPTLRLLVYDGNTLVRSYPVAVGMPGHDTPTGSFAISRAEWNPWWRPPARDWAKDDKDTPPGPSNPMGRVKLFFLPYYFIHGSPEATSIGTPASHGCVRMLNKDAIALARLLQSQGAPRVSSAQIDRILANSGQTHAVAFQDPIPVNIHYDPVVAEDGDLTIYPDFYGYNAIHNEAVYQALLAAGYDVRDVNRDEVARVVARAKQGDEIYSVKIKDAFDGKVASTLARAASRAR